MKKHLIRILTISFLLLLSVLPIKALDLVSEHYILYQLNEDTVLLQQDASDEIPIASLTKIMTIYTAIQLIDDLDDTIVLSAKVFDGLLEANASIAGFQPKQTVSYRDLLYGTFLPSGADGAQALALSLSGSIDAFVQKMNENAQELGLVHTHYTNTTGLDEENNYSSVQDVATLLRVALNDPQFYEIFTARSYTTSDNSLTFLSTLSMGLSYYQLPTDYILGAKTGYTMNAGRCLASIAYDKANEITYLLVTTGGFSLDRSVHLVDAIKTYQYYFDHYRYYTLLAENEIYLTLPANYSRENNYAFHLDHAVRLYHDDSFNPDLVSTHYQGKETVSFFTPLNTELGTVTVYYDETVIEIIPVLLQEKPDFSLILFLTSYLLPIGTVVILASLGILAFSKRKQKPSL